MASAPVMKPASVALQKAVAAGNINIGKSAGVEIMELSQTSLDEQEKHAILLKRVEAERRSRSIMVPTNKDEVAKELRKLGQPIRYFGENLADVRERLRKFLAKMQLEGEDVAFTSTPGEGSAPAAGGSAAGTSDEAASKKEQEKDVYTKASPELIAARRKIFHFSMERAANRLENVRRRKIGYAALREEEEKAKSSSSSSSSTSSSSSSTSSSSSSTSSSSSSTSSIYEESERVAGMEAVVAQERAALEIYRGLTSLEIAGSQPGDERPLACVRCAPRRHAGSSSSSSGGGGVVATGSLSSHVKLWDGESLELLGTLRGGGGGGARHVGEMGAEEAGEEGHTERCTGLAWHPHAYGGGGLGTGNILVTASADKTAKIWKLSVGGDGEDVCGGDSDAMDTGDGVVGGGGGGGKGGASASSSGGGGGQAGKCVMTLKGHEHRLGMVDVHPSGEYVGTASSDRTWRLWHLESGRELLLQDGHVHDVYFLSFQKDGALVASGDLAGVANVWDLRQGKKVMSLLGHVKRILGGDFSPNGFQLVTGGDDHSARVWDLRQRTCSYVLPAHGNLVSDVRFDASGEALLTASFDGAVKVWGARDWRPLRTLKGHEGKVMAADFAHFSTATPRSAAAGGAKNWGVFSVGYDRTLKHWQSSNEP